jgi:hypothetical protein
MLSAELLYQPCEFQQICHTEERTVLAHHNLRVRSSEIRPLRWNTTDCSAIDLQQQTSSLTVTTLANAGELFAV